MRMKKLNKKQFLIYFSIFGIGIVIGDLIEWGCFNLDNSISIIDALSLFVTVGLTIYIATILDKESKNKQFEVDLIVEQINEVENILKEIDSLIRQKPSYNEVNLKIHSIGLVKQNIFDLLKTVLEKDDLEKYEIAFKKKYKGIKDLLTNTPIDKSDKSKISMCKGLVSYTDDRIKEIVTETYSFRAEMVKLKLFVMQQ